MSGKTSHTPLRAHGQTKNFSSLLVASGAFFRGASLAVSFNGTAITWIGKKGPNYGYAQYAVDEGAPITFDAYNPTELTQNQNVSVSGLSNGSHVLWIQLLPQSDDGQYWQTVDAFAIRGTPLAQSSGTVAGYTSSQVNRSNPWICGVDTGQTDLSGGHCWSNFAGATMSWNFTGSLIEVFGRPDTEDGYMQVQIDNNPSVTVDLQYGTVDNDSNNSALLFAQKLASSGNHKITITVTGNHDNQGTNSYVQIDEFVAFP